MTLARGLIPVLLLAAIHGASVAEVSSPKWVRREGSLMMALRSNAPDFWHWAAYAGRTRFPPPLLNFTGVVAGDPHHENFSHVFVGDHRVYVLNDMDDSGEAPFFLELVKFMTVTLSATEDSGVAQMVQDLLQSYVEGLDGLPWAGTPPALIKDDATVSRSQFDRDYFAKIKKATTDGLFEPKEGLVSWKAMSESQRNQFNEFEKRYFQAALPADYTISDRALLAKEGGGSGGLDRYWYYLKKAGDQRHILEFKPLESPAVSFFQAIQPEGGERLRRATQIYWDKGIPEPFQIVGDALVTFWMRPRYPNYIDLNAKIFIQQPKKFAELSRFVAQALGQWHGKQAGAKGYVDYLKAHASDARTTAMAAADEYLTSARLKQTGSKP